MVFGFCCHKANLRLEPKPITHLCFLCCSLCSAMRFMCGERYPGNDVPPNALYPTKGTQSAQP